MAKSEKNMENVPQTTIEGQEREEVVNSFMSCRNFMVTAMHVNQLAHSTLFPKVRINEKMLFASTSSAVF